jgi:phytoene desaturase
MRWLNPAYRACFADGSAINVRYGREAMRDEIADKCGTVDAAAFDSFVAWLCQLYLLETPNFVDRTMTPRWTCCLRLALSLGSCGLGPFDALAPRCGSVRRPATPSAVQLPADVRRVFPDSALVLYAVITYMDTIEGVWFPEGGMHAVRMIMAQVAQKTGATFRYGDPVETILRSPVGRCPCRIRSANHGRRCGLHS